MGSPAGGVLRTEQTRNGANRACPQPRTAPPCPLHSSCAATPTPPSPGWDTAHGAPGSSPSACSECCLRVLAGHRGMWLWETSERGREQPQSPCCGGRQGWLRAGWIMDVFPFLALPPRALTGARLTAWCLHPVLSKNASKSSGESVREGFRASATISHTRNTRNSVPVCHMQDLTSFLLLRLLR